MSRTLLVLSVSLISSGCMCGTSPRPDGGTGGGLGFGGGSSTLGGGSGGGGGTGGGGSATGGGTGTGGGGSTGGGGGMTGDGGTTTDGGADAGMFDGGCVFMPAQADGLRRVVVSHPFPDDGGSRDNQYEVFELLPNGSLNATGRFFRMGRTSDPTSRIVFTPDRRIGLVAQEDGTIGVFRFDENNITVVHDAFRGTVYANKLVMQPSGNRVWVEDFNTQNNGGGLYQLDIACDGTLGNEVKVFAGNTVSSGVALPTAGQAMFAARSLGTSPMMQDVVLVDVSGATPMISTATTLFSDRDALASVLSATGDERLFAYSDNSILGGSRIAFFERTGTSTLTLKQVVTTPNPMGVAFSPFADVGLVVNSDGMDNFRRVTWDSTRSTFTISAPLTYSFGRPQLPTAPVMIERGMLRGRVLVAELDTIRQLQFETDGGITDVSETPAGGAGNGQILGTIGVTP